jgi:hypothetical protein
MMVMAAFRSSVVKYLRHRVWVPRPRTTCVDDYLSLRTERVLSAKKSQKIRTQRTFGASD